MCSCAIPEPVSETTHAHAVRRSSVATPQRSAAGHGVLRVQEQIQENLLQPPGIAVNRAADARTTQSRTWILRDLELVFQQRQRVRNDFVTVDFR